MLCSVTLSPTCRDLAKKLLDLAIIIGVKVKNTFCNHSANANVVNVNVANVGSRN